MGVGRSYGKLGGYGAGSHAGVTYGSPMGSYIPQPRGGFPGGYAGYGTGMSRPGTTGAGGGRTAMTGTTTKDRTSAQHAEQARANAIQSARNGNAAAATNHIRGGRVWASKVSDANLRAQLEQALSAAEQAIPGLVAQAQQAAAGPQVSADVPMQIPADGYDEGGLYVEDEPTGSSSAGKWIVGGVVAVLAVGAAALAFSGRG